MKIIKPGRKLEPLPKQFECERCGCIFEADERDSFIDSNTVYQPYGCSIEYRYEAVACPNCGKVYRLHQYPER